MRIPFDIKYRDKIESGEYKVKTRNGRTVRILCWDMKGVWPICAAVDYGDREGLYPMRADGLQYEGRVTDIDLFPIAPEPELTEFEETLGFAMGFSINDMEENRDGAIKHIKKAAAELLEIARKEFAKEHEHSVYMPEDTYYEQLKKEWWNGYEDGKAEALKDLPRWSPNDIFPALNDVVIGSSGTDAHFFIHRGRIIHLESLEKLPGFKED